MHRNTALAVVAMLWSAITAHPAHGLSPQLSASALYGDSNSQRAFCTATDGASLYVGGWFAGTLDFGPGATLVGVAPSTGFLAKLDVSGNGIWASSFAAAGTRVTVIAAACDQSGNVVITGFYRGPASLGGAPLPDAGAGKDEIFIAKFDPTGAHLWSRGITSSVGTWSASTGNGGTGVACDALGRIAIVGTVRGDVDFGTGMLSSPDRTIFLARFDAAGNTLGAARYGVLGAEWDFELVEQTVTCDPSNNIIMLGHFAGDIWIDGTVFTDTSGGAVLAKFTPLGALMWGRLISTPFMDWATGVVADTNGDLVYCTSPYTGTSLLSTTLNRLSPAGALLWSHEFVPSGQMLSSDGYFFPSLDGAGNILLQGAIKNLTLNFGGGDLVGQDQDIALAMFSSGGSHLWSTRFGDAGAQNVGAAAPVDASGDFWSVGWVATGAVDFGGGSLVARGSGDIAVARFHVPRCPPAGAPWKSSLYSVSGTSGGHGWSWAVSAPSVATIRQLNVSPVPSGGSALQLAQAFAASINSQACPDNHLFAQATAFAGTAYLSIRVGGGDKPTLGVGASGADPDCFPSFSLSTQCTFGGNLLAVDRVGEVNSSLGSGGYAIEELPTSELDCNANGQDDTVDIVFGISADANFDGIPDECQQSGVAEVAPEARRPWCAPNPFTASTTIHWQAGTATSTVVRIHDVRGRIVRQLTDMESSPGPRTVRWDGRDEAGRRVPAGLYLFEVGNGPEVRRGKVLLVD